MKQNDLKQGLERAFSAAEGTPPAFATTWAAAERRHAVSPRRQRAWAGLAAAVAVLAMTIVLWPSRQADEFLITDALLNSTSWSAPSDTLMPEHQFDIYREIPFLDGSTNAEEGTLL